MQQKIESVSGTLPGLCNTAYAEASPFSYDAKTTIEDLAPAAKRVIYIAESALELIRRLMACLPYGSIQRRVADIITDAVQKDTHSLDMYLWELKKHKITDENFAALAPVLAFQRKKLQAVLDILAYLRLEEVDGTIEEVVFEFDFTGTEDL
jgi:Na+/phosphate symporter